MPEIEIISHPLCPMAQRLVLIALATGWERNQEFAVRYLPYATLRDTAPRYAPRSELPVLYLHGGFRTDVTDDAAEYLDAVAGAGLLPQDPELRLRVRTREHKVDKLLLAMRGMFAAPSEDALKTSLQKVFDHLASIDVDLASDGTTEETTRMDMAALASAFSLLMFHDGLREHAMWAKLPRLHGIAKAIAAHPLVLASRCPDYGFEFIEFFTMTNSAFPAYLAKSHKPRLEAGK